MKSLFLKSIKTNVAQIALLSLFLCIVIEACGRHSLLRVFAFLGENPGAFFYNTLLIFITLAITLFFKRKIFMYLVICSLWLALGITNGIILSFRMTPFTVSDLALLENGLSILPNYMSTFEIILTAAVIVVALAAFVVAFLFAPKYKGKLYFLPSLLLLGILCLSLFGLTKVGLNERWLSNYFSNLEYAYEDYGVPYCFVNTWLNRGIDAPEGYSEQMIFGLFPRGIPAGIEEANNQLPVITKEVSQGEDGPNILFVQLESFFDPTLIKGLEYSADPIPNFHSLQKKYTNGYLLVPAFGAGTANTEFEVLTGMRIKSFGPGEYPYKTIVKDRTCESVNYVLKKSDYTCHAIHNHRGQFYGRNEVYSKLGFDTFTSLEYMNNVKKTPKNWAKDDVLTGEILAAMASTEGKDFVFTVSVQGHGEYPEEKMFDDADLHVKVTNELESEDYKNKVNYYLQQVYEMDAFVGALTAEIEKFPEKTLVVFYGDHLPVLDLSEEKMKNGSVYNTEYLMVSNYKMPQKDEDLTAFQLYSEVLNRVDIHNGILTWYHQSQREEKTYLKNLETLEYDMLYGENYVYGGIDPFIASRLHMGIREIVVEKIFNFAESTYVVGKNFTSYSKVAVDGKFVDTVFVNSKILRIPDAIKSSDPKEYSISQVGKYNAVLSTMLTDVE